MTLKINTSKGKEKKKKKLTITKIVLEVIIILNPFRLQNSKVCILFCYKAYTDMTGTLTVTSPLDQRNCL